jgi:hypothetical protein
MDRAPGADRSVLQNLLKYYCGLDSGMEGRPQNKTGTKKKLERAKYIFAVVRTCLIINERE